MGHLILVGQQLSRSSATHAVWSYWRRTDSHVWLIIYFLVSFFDYSLFVFSLSFILSSLPGSCPFFLFLLLLSLMLPSRLFIHLLSILLLSLCLIPLPSPPLPASSVFPPCFRSLLLSWPVHSLNHLFPFFRLFIRFCVFVRVFVYSFICLFLTNLFQKS